MGNQVKIITLFSSDATIQYKKDIFSVLALPRNSVFQFRYESKYIDPRVLTLLGNFSNDNIAVLIAFRSKSDCSDDKSFYIPIRWGTIDSIIHISNGYAINFKVDGYPSYTSDFMNSTHSFAGINECAKKYFEANKNNDYAVWGDSLPTVNVDDRTNSADEKNWFEIVRRLAHIPGNEDYYFFKCSQLYTEKYQKSKRTYTNILCTQKDSFTKIVEGKCTNIDIEYYTTKYSNDKNRQIDVFVDDNILSKSKGLKTLLQSRYGTKKLGFQSKKISNNTVTEITICTKSNVEELPTEIVIPVMIVKNRGYKLKKAIIMSIGALLVSLPGIIGSSIEVGWNIFIAGIGVAIMGINNYWESKE